LVINMKNAAPDFAPTFSALRQRAARRAALCAMAMLIPSIAFAAQWDVDPVRIELSPQQQTAAIIIRNESDQPTSIQISAVAWSQVDGKDVYMPTRELLVSPPIVTIPPKSDQVIRAALRRDADPAKELTYRINLQELPMQAEPGFTGVQVALRVGLPVFVQPQQGTAAPEMTWNVSSAPDNMFKVGMRNSGNAHVQVSDFSLYAPGSDQALSVAAGSSYVLAGQSGEWLLKQGSAQSSGGDRLRLKAYTDAEAVDTVLVLARP
jgi:fimbrial chaperone protein